MSSTSSATRTELREPTTTQRTVCACGAGASSARTCRLGALHEVVACGQLQRKCRLVVRRLAFVGPRKQVAAVLQQQGDHRAMAPPSSQHWTEAAHHQDGHTERRSRSGGGGGGKRRVCVPSSERGAAAAADVLSGVWPCSARALTSAPRPMSTRATWTWPWLHALCSAVHPNGSR